MSKKRTLLITVLFSTEDEIELFGGETEKSWYLLGPTQQKQLAYKDVILLPFNFSNPDEVESSKMELEEFIEEIKLVPLNAPTVVLAIFREDYDEVVDFLEQDVLLTSKFDKIIKSRNTKIANANTCIIPMMDAEARLSETIPVLTLFEFLSESPVPATQMVISGLGLEESVKLGKNKVTGRDFSTYLS